MKKIILYVTFIFLGTFCIVPGYSQITTKEDAVRKHNADTTLGWKAGGNFSFTFSQSSFSNWVGGGENAISGISDLNLFLKKTGVKSAWENNLQVRYGMQQLKKEGLKKTDDYLNFTSKYGYKAGKHWYYSALVTFTSQMTPGYSSDDASLKISDLMAPGYLFLALGFDYKQNDNLSIFLAPLTSKTTFVLDRGLSESGSFGVTPGQNTKSELGAYVKFFYHQEVIKNVTFQTKLNLFSNYLDKPQNIDVFWEVLLEMKINKYLSANILTNMLYDDNVHFAYDSNGDGTLDRKGPKLQFKEIFGLGINVSF